MGDDATDAVPDTDGIPGGKSAASDDAVDPVVLPSADESLEGDSTDSLVIEPLAEPDAETDAETGDAADDESDDEPTDESDSATGSGPSHRSRKRKSATPDEDAPAGFRQRVEQRARTMRYANNLHRPTFTPDEKERLEAVNRSASFWVPTLTVGLVALCAIVSVALAVRIVGNEDASVTTRTISVAGIALVLIGCFTVLLRSQDHFEHMRPSGRFVRNDIADAYEAVRDAPFLLVDLNASDELLQRVADLLPVAERLVDHLVEHEATSHTPVRLSPSYDELIKLGAEVNVVVEMRQEALGLKMPPAPGQWWTERVPGVGELPAFASLSDLASSLGKKDEPDDDDEDDQELQAEASEPASTAVDGERTIAQVKTTGKSRSSGLPPLRPLR